MGLTYKVFDKFSIICIIVGVILGFYMAFNNNDPNLWYKAASFLIVFSLLMTIAPTFSVILASIMGDEKVSISEIIEAFFLNFAMTLVCASFTLLFVSLAFGSLIPTTEIFRWLGCYCGEFWFHKWITKSKIVKKSCWCYWKEHFSRK